MTREYSIATAPGHVQGIIRALESELCPRFRRRRFFAGWVDRIHLAPQLYDQIAASAEMAGFRIEDCTEGLLLQGKHIDAVGGAFDARGVQHDIDQPLGRVDTAPEIVVLTIGKAEKSAEVI